jgi:hypothetical protein
MRSALLEPQVITLQRESENYIRRVEHEKKHYYSVEETWALVEKEWKEKKDRLVQVKILYNVRFKKENSHPNKYNFMLRSRI